MLSVLARPGHASRLLLRPQSHDSGLLRRSLHASACTQFSVTTHVSEGRRSGGGSSRDRREDKIKEQQGRREKWDKMKGSRHKMRLESLPQKGRSGGGQSQLLEARVRRARDQKEKFVQAREFVQRNASTQKERTMAEARILRQRSRQLKKRGTPGLGFTPARFRLLPIENESGTDLTALSNGENMMTIKELSEQVSKSMFDNIGLRADVVEAAKGILKEQLAARNPFSKVEPELRPTEIQALGIPEILGLTRISKKKPKTQQEISGPGPNVFLAAETGSGKTLAYALPIISQLKQEEEDNAGNIGKLRREKRPRALILVPSRELVKQVTSTLKKIGHKAKIRTVGLHLGVTRRHLRELVEQGPIDILVSTPGAILRYMGRDPILSPANIRRLVVDEADSMMDSHSFGDQMDEVLDMVRLSNETQGRREQAIFVSATLPKMIREQIIVRYPDVTHVTTPSLHRAPQKLSQTFIDVSKDYQGHRLNALWFVLRTAATDKHLIIFCNNKVHANLVYRQLYKRGVPSLLLVGGSRPPKKVGKEGPRRVGSAGGRERLSDEEEEELRLRARNSRRAPRGADAWERATWFAGQSEQVSADTTQAEVVEADEAEAEEEVLAEDEEVEDAVAEPVSGVDISDLKAPIPGFDREEVLRAFVSSGPIPVHLLPPIPAEQTAENEGLAGLAGSRKILVCTDLASRGLDTTCVTHVVLFDFPTTAIDYLHRSGRTARAGTRGKVTALVGKKDRRLADQIRLAIRQGGVIN
ncbi:hypothetical protein GGI03_000875 [Coemansia sp. RSA 2337]|nr:hypothetical protein GGI14_003363 [Coemansia sp. S680]KAJ2041560.1 hypothetical protein H4S03_000284 [Coemansia sp. S3946]KAJ2075669.1 hypothetical protein GGH13_000452 [Coemansia sp. S155-1]KAJ2117721.1 hypothetical protein IW146_000521 [Coemansia sp. RSA 922]KAJ2468627.1 hypothetical protein GGI03_000875 [Coemansia sp. RSA 2337]